MNIIKSFRILICNKNLQNMDMKKTVKFGVSDT